MTSQAELLTRAVEQLSLAGSLEDLIDSVTHAVREVLGADGATFVLREDGMTYYAGEDAIGPLWRGKRFPIDACVAGHAITARQTLVIADVFDDSRVPAEVYEPTFVRSLVMVPIREADPVGAIGVYWSRAHEATFEEVRLARILANSASVAFENLELRASLARRTEALATVRSRALAEALQTMVHDLRNPLGAMMGFAELLTANVGTRERQTEYAQSIQETCSRLLAQVERMLAIHRLSAHPVSVERISISELAVDVAAELRPSTGARQIEFVVEPGLEALADPTLVRSLLDNLLGNAVKYTQPRERARIALRALPAPTNELSTFVIEDNGVGFDESQVDRLFRPMARLHSEDEFPGNGLGLVSVARIVELHGGTVRAHGRVGEGAAFYFSLPSVAAAG
jgi:signal transduction histidine kinase